MDLRLDSSGELTARRLLVNAEYVISTYVSEVNLTGYLASGTSYAVWFHLGAIHQVIKEKFPQIFDDEPPKNRASTRCDGLF